MASSHTHRPVPADRASGADGKAVAELGHSAPADMDDPRARRTTPAALLGYVLIGMYLGFVFIQSEVVSWFRIQEMFRFQAFHMYGIIGSAVAVGAVSIQVVRRLDLCTIRGEPIRLEPKPWTAGPLPGARYWIGGTVFGVGWGLLGACPGPIFALIGAGFPVLVVGLLSAVVGAWTYGALRSHLPH